MPGRRRRSDGRDVPRGHRLAARRAAGRTLAIIIATADHRRWGVPVAMLDHLDAGAAAALLRDHCPGLPDAAAATLAAVAHHHPQALVDLARSLTPSQVAGSQPLPQRLPAGSGLWQTYRRRLAALPEPARRLLVLAAADPELDAASLHAAARLSDQDITELAPAEHAGLIQVGDSGITFSRPWVAILAYEEAPLAVRRDAHAVLAMALDDGRHRLRCAMHRAATACGPDPELAAELAAVAREEPVAYDLASAVMEQASRLSATAADTAARLVAAAESAWLAGSPQRARSLLEAAKRLRAAGGAGDAAITVTRTDLLTGEMELRSGAASMTVDALIAAADRFVGDRPRLAVRALLRAAEAITFSGDYERFFQVSSRAQALRAASTALGPVEEVMLETIAGFGATFSGDHAVATAALLRVIGFSSEVDSASAYTAASAAALLLADDHTAHLAASRAVACARVGGEASALPLALELMACAEYWLGRHKAAIATSHDGLRAARGSGQDNYAGDHLAMLAVLTAIRGEREESHGYLCELAVAPGAGRFNRPRALSLWALGVLDLIGGRPADAVKRLRLLGDPQTGRGHVVVQAMAVPWLVEAAARGGSRALAEASLELFALWADSTGDPARRALVARCRALLAPRGSAAARAHFEGALHLHAQAESEYETARTQLLFGQELRRSRRSRAARDHLHRALETFTRLQAPEWIGQTRAELRAAGQVTERPAGAAAAVLTAQQLQIAELVAHGATNREVAAALFLSHRTVDHHLRNIFTRLGIRSRTELARTLP